MWAPQSGMTSSTCTPVPSAAAIQSASAWYPEVCTGERPVSVITHPLGDSPGSNPDGADRHAYGDAMPLTTAA